MMRSLALLSCVRAFTAPTKTIAQRALALRAGDAPDDKTLFALGVNASHPAAATRIQALEAAARLSGNVGLSKQEFKVLYKELKLENAKKHFDAAVMLHTNDLIISHEHNNILGFKNRAFGGLN